MRPHWVLLCICAAGWLDAEEAPETVFSGRLAFAERVARAALLDRGQVQAQIQGTVKVREVPLSLDPATGAVRGAGLNPKSAYDLFVELKDGVRAEGVALPEEAGLPAEGRKEIEGHFYGMKQFTNENRILRLTGGAQTAVALVELCRTSEFHAGKGDVIWRIEVWKYRRDFGAWQPDGTQVLRRFRVGRREWGNWRWLFVPAWGGLRPGAPPRIFTWPAAGECCGRRPEAEVPGAAEGEGGAGAPPAEGAGAAARPEEDLKDLRDPGL